MAKTTIEIDVNTGDAAKSLSELKGEFKDLQNTLENLTPGTKEYIDTLKNLGSVKNDIEDVKKELNAFADGTSNLSAFSGVLSGVVSGFEAASGAAALFGLNSGVLEEQIKNLQAVMAFSEGIKGVLETGESFKKLGNAIKSSAVGAKAMAVAQRILNAVMAANPIALIVAGLTALVGVIALVVNAMGDEDEAQKEVIKNREKELELMQDANKAFAKEAEFRKNLAAAQGKSAQEQLALNEELSKQRIKQIDAEIQTQKKLIFERLARARNADEEERNDLYKANADTLKLMKDLADERLSIQRNLQIESTKLETDTNKAAADKAKERAENAKKLAEENAKWRIEFEKEVLRRQAEMNKEFEDSQKKKQEEQDKIDADRIEAEIQAEQKKLDAQKAARLKAVEDYKKGEEEKTKLALQGLQSVQSLVDAFAGKSEASQKKAFQIKKAASLAQATIETYQAAQSAFASQMAIPTPDAPIRANIAAAIAIASGLARVAVIAKTKFEGGGGGGATGGGAGNLGTFTQGGGGQPPQGLTAQNTVTQLNPDGTVAGQGQRQAAPMKAYVVESESRAVTERVNKLSNNSKIG
ncbi:MAG: hypothetical protein RIR01_1512 [Bacteroidota bacterium]|jgi:hypothetical protein